MTSLVDRQVALERLADDFVEEAIALGSGYAVTRHYEQMLTLNKKVLALKGRLLDAFAAVEQAAPVGKPNGPCLLRAAKGVEDVARSLDPLADARKAIREADAILSGPITEETNKYLAWLTLPAVVAAVKEEKG